jgi:hypothetical protein
MVVAKHKVVFSENDGHVAIADGHTIVFAKLPGALQGGLCYRKSGYEAQQDESRKEFAHR